MAESVRVLMGISCGGFDVGQYTKGGESIDSRLSRMEDIVNRLDALVFGVHGSLTLEKRLENHVETRLIHKQKSNDEIAQNLLHLISQNRTELLEEIAQNRTELLAEHRRSENKWDANHMQNGGKMDRLTWLVAVGLGAVLALQFLAPYIKPH